MANLCYNLPMKLIIASNNAHKMREISEILGAEFPDMVTLKQAGLEIDVVEDGDTFAANAIKKAEEVRLASGFPAALADDSGLIVDALGGAPGLYSARFAGRHGDSAANNARLLRELEGLDLDQRGAHFHAVIVLLRHAGDPQPLIAEGVWPGTILHAPRGTGGFGYDPLFLDREHGLSAAELDPAVKNAISHRGRALARLRERLPALLAAWPEPAPIPTRAPPCPPP